MKTQTAIVVSAIFLSLAIVAAASTLRRPVQTEYRVLDFRRGSYGHQELWACQADCATLVATTQAPGSERDQRFDSVAVPGAR